jgi:hypothetical protein
VNHAFAKLPSTAHVLYLTGLISKVTTLKMKINIGNLNWEDWDLDWNLDLDSEIEATDHTLDLPVIILLYLFAAA